MSVAPELLPNSLGTETPDVQGPFSGLFDGVPEHFGEPYWDITRSYPGDLFPENEETYKKLLTWCQTAFTAAESYRSDFDRKWSKFYKLYRSYIEKKPGDWRSTVFIPMCFWVIETVTPRLVAQLPKFSVYPVGPEDVEAAQTMETLMDWATKNSGLYEQLVAAFKSSLKYGTGILKTYHATDTEMSLEMQPVLAPLRQTFEMPVGQDMAGNPITEPMEMDFGEIQVGEQPQPIQRVTYDGPKAECIDIFNFYPAPEAKDIQSARYVIHRSFQPMSYIERMVADGVYHYPPDAGPEYVADTSDNPALDRLNSIGYGGAGDVDPTHKQVEILEFWLDDGRVITMANRKCLLRVARNPFLHQMKPFVRIVDYYQEHEFWGVGEIEPLEGIQDARNALTNSRIDNIRLLLNSMFYVNTDAVLDLDDFKMRPGGLIRGRGNFKADEVFERIDLGDVTSSVFSETELLDQTSQKVSGVSDYTMGTDNASLNDTATGVAIIQEQGASRFGLKTKLIELMGVKDLGKQYASLLQQFTDQERQVRLVGPTGQVAFQTIDQSSILGGLDIDIQAESMVQSQTMKIEQRQNLLGLLAQFAPQGVNAALGEVLEAMGIKDKERYIYGDPNDPMSQAIYAQQMMMLGLSPDGQPMPPQQPALPAPGTPGMDPTLTEQPSLGTPGGDQAQAMLGNISQSYDQGAQQ